jgi:CubicO group peptidase (beta-lactamase class C family)
MISCVGDMLKWFQFHLGDPSASSGQAQAADGTPFLSAETLRAMKQPQTTISTTPGNELEWGLGWQLNTIDGARVFAHGGGTLGQISYTLGIPEHNFAIAMMTNSSRGGKLIEVVNKWVLERQLGLTMHKPQRVELSAEQLQRLTGTYATTLTTSRVELADGQLALTNTMRWPVTGEEVTMPTVTLAPVSEWEVMVIDEHGEEGGVVAFIPGPDDRARYFRLGRIATRVE